AVAHQSLHLAVADLEIDRIHARRAHLDEQIARARHWTRDLLDLDRRAVRVDPRGLQAAPTCARGRRKKTPAVARTSTVAPATRKSRSIPSLSASTPERSMPSTWASENMAMNVLETRPCI